MPSSHNYGFIAASYGATVKNLTIKDVNFSLPSKTQGGGTAKTDSVGALVGLAQEI